MPPAGAVAVSYDTETNYGAGGSIDSYPVGSSIVTLTGGASNTNSLTTLTSGLIHNQLIWTQWNQSYTNSISVTASTITGTMTINNETWGAWNQALQNAVITQVTSNIGGTINAATTNQIITQVWGAWNVQYQQGNLRQAPGNLRTATPEQVREEQERYRVRQEQYQAQQAKVQLERSEAEKRAEQLLTESLTPQQREELTTKRYFTLETITPTGDRRIYRIHRGRSRNVEQVDASGRRLKTLCAHPAELVPDPDTMLAQKFMLETAEEEFLRIANHS